jgi:hypothetical protein
MNTTAPHICEQISIGQIQQPGLMDPIALTRSLVSFQPNTSVPRLLITQQLT